MWWVIKIRQIKWSLVISGGESEAICSWRPGSLGGWSECACPRGSCRFCKLSSSASHPSCSCCPPRCGNCWGMVAWSQESPSSSFGPGCYRPPESCSCLRPHALQPCWNAQSKSSSCEGWIRWGTSCYFFCRKMALPHSLLPFPSRMSMIWFYCRGKSWTRSHFHEGYLNYNHFNLVYAGKICSWWPLPRLMGWSIESPSS